jgi:flagellar biosynthetic protein FlhB
MADTDTADHDRTEAPSAKRLEDARRHGQLARSRELSMTAVTLAGAAVLWGGQSYFSEGMRALMARGLDLPRATLLDPGSMAKLLADGVYTGLRLIGPLWIAVLVASVAGAIALGGFAFSLESLLPKFERLDPIAGFKRVFGWHGLAELAKALAKFALVAVATWLLLRHLARDFLELGTLTLQAALGRSAGLAAVSLVTLSATLVLIAAADVPFQYWQHRRQLRMTKQEAKDEQKETEGRPEVRSRLRQLQRTIATRRMMSDVPKADLVAMNPSHFAVALRYDPAKMKAPRVVAKGADLIALNIRRVAEAHNVPIFEHPQFTRALYFTSEIGEEISPRLYVAVAQVLTYIYQLTGRTVAGAKRAAKPAAKPGSVPKRPEIKIEADLLEPRRGRAKKREAEAARQPEADA